MTYEPPGLRELVENFKYKPKWQIYLAEEYEDDGAGGLYLFIVSHTEDSIKPDQTIRVRHGFLVPAASYNKQNWKVWILDRCGDVEMHERNEFARFYDVREFAPHHGNGENPYVTWIIGTPEEAAKRAGDD